MNRMKKHIIESFKKQYGFAPTMKDITPMESCERSHNVEWLAFCVNGIGYDCKITGEVERNENYDM